MQVDRSARGSGLNSSTGQCSGFRSLRRPQWRTRPRGEGIGDGAVGIVVATGERGYDDLWGVSLGILRLMLKSYIQVHRSFL